MNKRGDTTVWHEVIKAIPAMMLVLILLAAGVKIYNSLHPEQYSIEKKDLLRIVSEIKDLKSPVSGNFDQVIVPIFSKNYTFKAINTASSISKQAYLGCNLDYCVCFFKNTQPLLCETFNLRKEFMTNGNNCPSNEGDYKNVEFITSGVSIDKSIVLKRIEPCKISISSI